MVPFVTSRTPDAFHRLLGDEGVTVVCQAPSALRQLIHADAAAEPALRDRLRLRLVIYGGEASDVAMLEPWWDLPRGRAPQARPRLWPHRDDRDRHPPRDGQARSGAAVVELDRRRIPRRPGAPPRSQPRARPRRRRRRDLHRWPRRGARLPGPLRAHAGALPQGSVRRLPVRAWPGLAISRVTSPRARSSSSAASTIR